MMQVRLLVTTSATALLMVTAVGLAQEEITTDDTVSVSVSVDGTMVEVPVSLAAQACDVDEAAIRANAFTEVMAAKDGGEETTVSPEPAKTTEDMMSSDGVATTDTSLSAAETPDVASQPEGSAADPDAAEIADEVATAAEVGDDTTGVAGRAATAGNSADPATTDEAVQAVNGDQLQENADADTGVAGLRCARSIRQQRNSPVFLPKDECAQRNPGVPSWSLA